MVKVRICAVDHFHVTDAVPKNWSTVCELTGGAMDALADVERRLLAVDYDSLDPLEFRALLWAKCSLATLYGIRADESLGDPAMVC